MYQSDFLKSLSEEELKARGLIVPFKVFDYATLARIDRYSMEFEKTWDELINTAILKLMDDIETVKRLRK